MRGVRAQGGTRSPPRLYPSVRQKTPRLQPEIHTEESRGSNRSEMQRGEGPILLLFHASIPLPYLPFLRPTREETPRTHEERCCRACQKDVAEYQGPGFWETGCSGSGWTGLSMRRSTRTL
jgi:hypothetical protein